jgi:hypothetical protein
MSNPFRRKRRDPVDQALAAIEEIRAEAAKRAAGLRDAASDAVELLGEAAPEARRHRVPIAAAVVAAAVGTAIALRSRRKGKGALEPTPAEPPVPSAAATAAQATATQPSRAAETPAAAVGPEQPKEPQARTDESEAAGGEA